jgi:DNA-binding transcriptional ArsR family regulator
MRIAPTAEVSEMLDNAVEAAGFLKKLANPARLMIVCALVDGERSVRDLEDTLRIRQPGLSQQLAELREAGFIEGRKESKSVFYRLADDRIAGFIDVMYRMFCATSESVETASERPSVPETRN